MPANYLIAGMARSKKMILPSGAMRCAYCALRAVLVAVHLYTPLRCPILIIPMVMVLSSMSAMIR